MVEKVGSRSTGDLRKLARRSAISFLTSARARASSQGIPVRRKMSVRTYALCQQLEKCLYQYYQTASFERSRQLASAADASRLQERLAEHHGLILHLKEQNAKERSELLSDTTRVWSGVPRSMATCRLLGEIFLTEQSLLNQQRTTTQSLLQLEEGFNRTAQQNIRLYMKLLARLCKAEIALEQALGLYTDCRPKRAISVDGRDKTTDC